MDIVRSYPGVTRGKIVLWGMMGALPFGGMVWQVYHYVVALRRLGFDVWYVEDSDRPVYNPTDQNPTTVYAANVALLEKFMSRIGMADRWVFRPPGVPNIALGGADYGGLLQLYAETEAAINLCGAQEPREIHQSIQCRIYLETDPVENQVAVAKGHQGVISYLAAHDFHFTYGENLGFTDCPVPMGRFRWRPTRPPVCLDLWFDPTTKPGPTLSTIAKWSHQSSDVAWKGYDSKDVVWNDNVWRWSKHHEFMRFAHFPEISPLPLEIALSGAGEGDLNFLRQAGWRIKSAEPLNEPGAYRKFIRASRGEFTVAKDQYVSPKSGWFSDRSVCYLAAGRPVVTQDTGFSKFIPSGEGLLAFTNEYEARDAIGFVAEDYERHSVAALEIAREYFGCEKVVRQMLSDIGVM
jgi:hypothetical protein